MSNKKPNPANGDPSPDKRVTLRDIAKAIGVSHTTVSMSLINHPSISEKRRKQVQQMAEEMGYRPDPMLSALSNYRFKKQEHPVQAALAWLNPWDNPEELRSYHEFDLYWQGASKTAFKLGYNLEEFALKHIPVHRLEQVLKARNIRGLLIPPCRGINVDWKAFDWSHFSVIRLGRTKQHPPVNFVTSAQLQNAVLAFNKILQKGYKRIGFIGEQELDETFGAGILWAQQAIPVRRRLTTLLLKKSATDAECIDILAKWMKKCRPDAIFTREKRLPQLLTSLGYRIPEDIGLATTSIIDTPIDAGITQNSEEIGRAAVLALISLIHNSIRGIPAICNETLVEGSWVDGSMLPDRN